MVLQKDFTIHFSPQYLWESKNIKIHWACITHSTDITWVVLQKIIFLFGFGQTSSMAIIGYNSF